MDKFLTPRTAILGGTALGVGIVGVRILRRKIRDNHLRKAIVERRDLRDSIETELRQKLKLLLPEEEEKWEKILQFDFNSLIENLQNETVLPVEALHAYQWQALKAQELTNCVCLFFKEAEDWAMKIQEEYQGKSLPKPPLYGVPISLKENLMVKGYDNTLGFASRIGAPAEEDGVMVVSLRKLGAIPFLHSNVPQSLASYITCNPIYGLTTHPMMTDRTPGGSTGGEAALIALGGSPVGIGGDLGGSIRLPCHWSGITGIRPTSGRFTKVGSVGVMPGIVVVGSSSGPMARDVETLITVLRHLWAPASPMFQMDPLTTPLNFQNELLESQKPLTIGYYASDPTFAAVPACQRAVTEAREKLETIGHKLIYWVPPDTEYARSLLGGAVWCDDGKVLLKQIYDDIPEPLNTKFHELPASPQWLNRLKAKFTRKEYKRIDYTSVPRSCDELRQVYVKILTYKKAFVQQWQEAGLDCLICPPQAAPALPHAVATDISTSPYVYTAIYNVLDFPGCVGQFSCVNEDDIRKTQSHYPSVDERYRKVKSASSEGSLGLPVGVQCIAPPNRDEICLRVIRELQAALEPAQPLPTKGLYEVF